MAGCTTVTWATWRSWTMWPSTRAVHYLASVSRDFTLKVYRLADGRMRHSVSLGRRSPKSMCFVDEHTVIVGNYWGELIKFDLETERVKPAYDRPQRHQLGLHAGPQRHRLFVRRCSLPRRSCGPRRRADASCDGSACLWSRSRAMPEQRGRDQPDSSSWPPLGRAAICSVRCSIRIPRFFATTRSLIPRASITHSITAMGRSTWGRSKNETGRPLAFLERIWSANLGHRCVGFKMTRGQNEVVL